MPVKRKIRYKRKTGSMKFAYVLICCSSEKQEIGNIPHGKAMQSRSCPPHRTALGYYL